MADTTELLQKFDKLQRKRDEANNNMVALQTKIDSAKEAIKQITDGWQATYGFADYDSAVAKLNELEAEINTTISVCETYLSQVDGGSNGGFGEV